MALAEVKAVMADMLSHIDSVGKTSGKTSPLSAANTETSLASPFLEDIQRVGATFDAIDEECKTLARMALEEGGDVQYSGSDIRAEAPGATSSESSQREFASSNADDISQPKGYLVEEAKGAFRQPLRESSLTLSKWVAQEEVEKLEEAKQLVLRLKREKLHRKKRKEQLKAREDSSFIDIQRKDQEAAEKTLKEKNEERLRAHTERRQKEAKKREERRQALARSLSFRVKKKQRLHQKMASGFHRSFLVEREVEHKRKLQQLKEERQQPRLEDIRAHQKWYQENVRQISPRKQSAPSHTESTEDNTTAAVTLRRRLAYGHQVRNNHKPTRFKPFSRPTRPTVPRSVSERQGVSRSNRGQSTTAIVVHESQKSIDEENKQEVFVDQRAVARLQRLNAQIQQLSGQELKEAVTAVDKISKVCVKRLQSKLTEYQKLVTE